MLRRWETVTKLLNSTRWHTGHVAMPHSVQPDQELLSQAQIPAVQGERGRSSVTSRYSHGCEHGISVTAVTGTLLQAVHKAVATCEKQ